MVSLISHHHHKTTESSRHLSQNSISGAEWPTTTLRFNQIRARFSSSLIRRRHSLSSSSSNNRTRQLSTTTKKYGRSASQTDNDEKSPTRLHIDEKTVPFASARPDCVAFLAAATADLFQDERELRAWAVEEARRCKHVATQGICRDNAASPNRPLPATIIVEATKSNDQVSQNDLETTRQPLEEAIQVTKDLVAVLRTMLLHQEKGHLEYLQHSGTSQRARTETTDNPPRPNVALELHSSILSVTSLACSMLQKHQQNPIHSEWPTLKEPTRDEMEEMALVSELCINLLELEIHTHPFQLPMLLPHYQQLISSQLDSVLTFIELPNWEDATSREIDNNEMPPSFLEQKQELEMKARNYLLKLLWHSHLSGYLPATEDGKSTIARDWLEPLILTPFLKWQQRQLWVNDETPNQEMIQSRGWKFLLQLLQGIGHEFNVKHVSSPHKIWQLVMHLVQSDSWEKRRIKDDNEVDNFPDPLRQSEDSLTEKYGAQIMAWLEPSLLALHTAFHSYSGKANDSVSNTAENPDDNYQDDASVRTAMSDDSEALLEQAFFEKFMDVPSFLLDDILATRPEWPDQGLLSQIQDPRAFELAGVIWSFAQNDGNTVQVFDVAPRLDEDKNNAAELGSFLAVEGLNLDSSLNFEAALSKWEKSRDSDNFSLSDAESDDMNIDSLPNDDLFPERCEFDDEEEEEEELDDDDEPWWIDRDWPRERYHVDEYPDVWEQLVDWSLEEIGIHEEPFLNDAYYDHLERCRNLGSTQKYEP